eukprot:2102552-Rhodomonas_salina.1
MTVWYRGKGLRVEGLGLKMTVCLKLLRIHTRVLQRLSSHTDTQVHRCTGAGDTETETASLRNTWKDLCPPPPPPPPPPPLLPPLIVSKRNANLMHPANISAGMLPLSSLPFSKAV